MIAAASLHRLASSRLVDAETLLAAERFDGAIYLAGYAVELALKARICKTLDWETFPETSGEFKGLATFRTHDLNLLLRLSGIERRVLDRSANDWEIVRAWGPTLRYATRQATNAEARRFFEAVSALLLDL